MEIEPSSRPLVDWFAGRIQDPVTRLRFLQAVAPPPESRTSNTRGLCLVLPGCAALILLSLCVVQAGGHRSRQAAQSVHAIVPPQPRSSTPAGVVWLVEKADESEVYSNGLRIDDRFRVASRSRSYVGFPIAGGEGVRRSEPAGIVFHATQSRQAPFEADQNGVLKKIGESLLDYVRRKRAYHFLIDRFGRVYRVVAETDSANHAGNSVWGDESWLYVNLNQSFLGVAIEALNRRGDDALEMSPAQLHAAAMLIEMLRSRYKISAENCITHAQVSVNPSNMQVGYHTDWASGFPFAQLGLPDNYLRPLPALWAFGFETGPEYLQWASRRLTRAVEAAEVELAEAAEKDGMSLHAYRKSLQNQYRVRLAAVRHVTSSDADESE